VEGSVSAETQAWAARIEALRQDLLRSTDEIEHTGRVTVSEVCRSASRPPQWARLLFEIVRAFRPEQGLELGTSLGMSASYEAAALELNAKGRLVTLEGCEDLVNRARAHFEQLELADRIEVVLGSFQDTLQPTLDRLGSVGYAFVDGNHDRDATLTYFAQLAPHLLDGAVVVFDDISWSPGMADAWTTLMADPRVSLSVDLFKVGICIVGGPHLPRQRYTVAID
jgi:predicted O-methyltransferase YrrM